MTALRASSRAAVRPAVRSGSQPGQARAAVRPALRSGLQPGQDPTAVAFGAGLRAEREQSMRGPDRGAIRLTPRPGPAGVAFGAGLVLQRSGAAAGWPEIVGRYWYRNRRHNRT